jgi:hypothetical protein
VQLKIAKMVIAQNILPTALLERILMNAKNLWKNLIIGPMQRKMLII